MVQQSLKSKVLGKEKKIALVTGQRRAALARKARDDKRWKRVLAKKAPAKKALFAALEKVSRRGTTRRLLAKREKKPDAVAYECTVHLAKVLKGRTFHKRAPTAVKKIRDFAQRLMRTKDNRVDAQLNNFLWSNGVKGVPGRVRVRIQRKVAEQQENGSKRKHLYTVISHVPVDNFKGLLTKQSVKASA